MNSRLVISERHHQVLCHHATATYPEECCGVLLGTQSRDGDRETSLVERVLSIENEREDSRHNRFLIQPETVLSAHKEARRLGLDVLGYYHSHPDHPAVPSEYDREHAWPGMSYVIVSVEDGRAVDTRSWRLAEDRDRFLEESFGSHGDPDRGAAEAQLQEVYG